MLRDAAGLALDRAREVFGEGARWERATLRCERAIVVGAGLRRAMVLAGAPADRLAARVMDPIVRAARDARTEPREFLVGPTRARVLVRVGAREVSVEPFDARG